MLVWGFSIFTKTCDTAPPPPALIFTIGSLKRVEPAGRTLTMVKMGDIIRAVLDGKEVCSIGVYQKRAIDQQINMMENPVQS